MPNLCIFPARALKHPALTATDIRVLAAIGTHTDRDGAGCWANSKTLADEADVSPSTFFASTKRLLSAGLIERTSGQLSGRSSDYRVLLDSHQPAKLGVSGEPDTPSPASRIPVSPAPDTPTINDPSNDPLNESSRTAPTVITVAFAADYVELLHRVEKAGGSRAAWRAEMGVALDGMHGPKRTAEEIGQAIRDFNASGADISLRLFRGYLRGSDAAGADRGSSEPQGGKNGRKRGYTLAAVELIQRLKKKSSPNPTSGGPMLTATWKEGLTEPELRVIQAVGPFRILNDTNEGTLVSQLAKALEEASA